MSLIGTGSAEQLRDQRLRSDLKNRPGFPQPIGGGVTANVNQAMIDGWTAYWADHSLIGKGFVAVGSGGQLSKATADRAVYWREGIDPFEIRPDDNLNLIANIDPEIAAEWKRTTGFEVVPL